MSAATILNMNSPAAQASAFNNRTPIAASGSNDDSSSPGGDAGTISSNDFLTLLVTEMKNQDPTSTQDPNEYINQLVQVNSLQQLISINEVLTNSLGNSATPSPDVARATTGTSNPDIPTAGIDRANIARHESPQAIARTAGNLSIPAANPSASGIAHALDGTKRVAGPR